jgi:hypothetical protein
LAVSVARADSASACSAARCLVGGGSNAIWAATYSLGETLRFGLLRGDVGLQRGDQTLDAGDFGGLGGFVVLGVLHVVPRGVVGGERGGAEPQAEGADGAEAEDAEPARPRASGGSSGRAGPPFRGGRRAAAVFRRSGLLGLHLEPPSFTRVDPRHPKWQHTSH